MPGYGRRTRDATTTGGADVLTSRIVADDRIVRVTVAGPLRICTGFLCRRRLDDVTCERVVSRLTKPLAVNLASRVELLDLQVKGFGYEVVNVAVATLGSG